jgi:DNA-binding NtrC family response regulator
MPRWDVLVVEDEPVVRGAVERILSAEGFRVAVTEDAEAALTHPAADECQVVLSDLVLPRQSGLDLLRALGERRPDLPVVIMTGYASAEAMARARECGASAFLPKPFDEAELLDATKGAMADVSARRES